MPRISIDTNILVYACDPTEGEKCETARRVIRGIAGADSWLTQQVIGEFLNVSRKMHHLNQRRLRRIAVGFAATFPIISTPRDALFEAFDRSGQYQLQFWDAVIVTVCIGAEVNILLSEDYQDGIIIDGLLVRNPLVPGFDLATLGVTPPS